jgi:hypothetical protein
VLLLLLLSADADLFLVKGTDAVLLRTWLLQCDCCVCVLLRWLVCLVCCLVVCLICAYCCFLQVAELKYGIGQLVMFAHFFAECAHTAFLCRAAELKYGTLMELQKQLKAAEGALGARAGGQRMLKEEVTEADIAEIISKWTGVRSNQAMTMRVVLTRHVFCPHNVVSC